MQQPCELPNRMVSSIWYLVTHMGSLPATYVICPAVSRVHESRKCTPTSRAIPLLPGRTFTPHDAFCQDHTRSHQVKILVQNFPPRSLSLLCTFQAGLWWGEDHLCDTQQTQEWSGLPSNSPDNHGYISEGKLSGQDGCTQQRLSVVLTFFQCQPLEHGLLSDGEYMGKVTGLGWVECHSVCTVWKPIALIYESSSLFIKQIATFCYFWTFWSSISKGS